MTHKACLSIDWESLNKQMRTPILFDGRRVLDIDDLKSKGWKPLQLAVQFDHWALMLSTSPIT